MALLENEAVDTFLADHSEWSRQDDSITRTFEFDDFNESLGFVVRVGMEAEKANHHPDIDIRWNQVTLTLSTHSEGGLTKKDTDLAAIADGLT